MKICPGLFQPMNILQCTRFAEINRQQYNVIYKHFMGRYERMLTIDGEHIHLVAVDKKILDMSSKTTSYHISSVISCKQNKKSLYFKLIVLKNVETGDMKSYDLEASSISEAAEICSRVTFICERLKA